MFQAGWIHHYLKDRATDHIQQGGYTDARSIEIKGYLFS